MTTKQQKNATSTIGRLYIAFSKAKLFIKILTNFKKSPNPGLKLYLLVLNINKL